MTGGSSNKLKQFTAALETWKLMETAGVSDDSFYRDFWEEWGLFPDAKVASKSQAMLQEMLLGKALGQVHTPATVTWPDVAADEAVCGGFEIGSNRPVPLRRSILVRHVLVLGSSGSGKTTFFAWLLDQLLRAGVTCQFEDHKGGEGRKLLHRYPDTMVFRPFQEFWNILQPVGPSAVYWTGLFSEFGRAFNLRPETWTELAALMQRVEQGLRPGEAYPSLKDFERLLFILAAKESRTKFGTAAHAMASLTALLGRTASIRRAPQVRFRIVVHEYAALPPRVHGFLAAIRFLRTQLGSNEGDSPLKHLYISDEATMEFGKELSQAAGSGYIGAQKRLITQVRLFCTGVLAGAQVGSELDDSLKSNVATICVFRCPSPKEAREAAAMIRLPENRIHELLELEVGEAFLYSEGFSGPVKVRIPNFSRGPHLGDTALAARLAAQFAALERSTEFSPKHAEAISPLSYRAVLGEQEQPDASPVEPAPSTAEPQEPLIQEYLDFLREVEAHPDCSVTDHFKSLAWSAGRGTRVKERLIGLGLLRMERQKSMNGRPRELLILTERGSQLLTASKAHE